MPIVRKKAIVGLPPERVYDLVADVKGFARFSSYIKDIAETSPGVYSWEAGLLGMTLKWDAVVTEDSRPTRFAWASTSGVFNRGSYTFSPSGEGTEITFEMEFDLSGYPFGELLSPALAPVISAVADEIMKNIKKGLSE